MIVVLFETIVIEKYEYSFMHTQTQTRPWFIVSSKRHASHYWMTQNHTPLVWEASALPLSYIPSTAFLYSVILGLNILTRRMSRVCASVRLSVCLCVCASHTLAKPPSNLESWNLAQVSALGGRWRSHQKICDSCHQLSTAFDSCWQLMTAVTHFFLIGSSSTP